MKKRVKKISGKSEGTEMCMSNELRVYSVFENIRGYVNCVSVFFSEIDARLYCEDNRNCYYEKHTVK